MAGSKISGDEAQEAGVEGVPGGEGDILVTDAGECFSVLKHFWAPTFAVEGDLPDGESEEWKQ